MPASPRAVLNRHRSAPHGRQRVTIARRIQRAPETARFLRQAAPAFFRELSREYGRESEPAPLHPDPRQWPDTGLHAAWLGHSTVFLKIDGFTIVTDPVFSARIGLGLGPITLGIKRLVDVATSAKELPHVDLILLSHAHMDHFDLPSLRFLESKRTAVVTADQTANLLRRRRFGKVTELRWDESVQVGPACVRAFEVQHWGARMRSDQFRGYNGYLVEISGKRFVFGGDTAYTQSFRQLRSAGRVDLAIMPIGAYDPWIRVHCTPEQAWSMAHDCGAQRVLAVHHQTFKLGRESRYEPIERLLRAAGADANCVAFQQVGEDIHM